MLPLSRALTHRDREAVEMSTVKTVRLESWIAPQFAWTAVPDAFVAVVSTKDREITRFISVGSVDLPVRGTKSSVAAMATILGAEHSLHGELLKAAWDPSWRPKGRKTRQNSAIRAFFGGAFLLPDGEHIAVVFRRSELNHVVWLTADCKAKADDLVAAHVAAVAQFDETIRAKRLENEVLYNRPEMQPYKGSADQRLAEQDARDRPTLTTTELLPLLPRGAVFEVRAKSPEALTRQGIRAIVESKLPLSRDGSYQGILPPGRRRSLALVTWTPYIGPPAYPEIRAAVEARVRSAFAKARRADLGRPEFEYGIESVISGPIDGGQARETFRSLANLRLDTPDAAERADRSRLQRQDMGFEALAWYQAHHVWSEETWGVYFDAAKLDDLAFSILQDLRSSTFIPHELAAFLALGLTLAHELFHARVEAATTWLELSSLQPRHLRYSQRVYEAVKETPQWLEEGLANWSAWTWFKSNPIQGAIARYSGLQIEHVVENVLDLSPPGYRDWRQGEFGSTWRVLATQLAEGKPNLSASSIGLPLESQLAGPFPYDFASADVPIRFVGEGVICDRLLSRPTTFNVPARAELERALKHFKHVKDRSGGKGSHEKWTGPDERAFILPRRDPISDRVFRTFLQHVGIDKTAYVHSIRPNL
jgi:hypothetical protein